MQVRQNDYMSTGNRSYVDLENIFIYNNWLLHFYLIFVFNDINAK